MDRVRNAIKNSRDSKRNNRISIVTILLFFILVGIEIMFLSHVLNAKIDNAVEVFAPFKMANQSALENSIYALQDIKNDTVPKAELIESHSIDKNRPVIALTFDDGPHPQNTINILQTLSKYHAKATFFMVGENVERNQGIPQKVIDQGSEIGTHTWDHKNLTKLSETDILDEITRGSKVIEENCGASVKFLRPPYGSNNELVRNIAKQQNKAVILWNVDTEDWKSRDAEMVYRHVIENVKDGDIVLMHDIYGSTAEATEKIVKELTEKGYQFVTISELFQVKGKPLNYGEKYYNCQ
ncbi:MAG: polysaccharide deacetylase family protein [Clostridia bacterium]|nr:polysaccharide deacetylase family protein [Clostridia bacterium]